MSGEETRNKGGNKEIDWRIIESTVGRWDDLEREREDEEGGLCDGESRERGREKRNKQGKNGTKGQLFITLLHGPGVPAVIWCVVESMQRTHTQSHQQPLNTKYNSHFLFLL